MPGVTDKIETFSRLHDAGCFVIPNPWDVGSAKLLQGLGFKAVATTSSGYAATLGRADYGVTLDEALAHFRAVASAVDVPVNGDFEGGFATAPEGVAANVGRAVHTGIAGLSIEDSTRSADKPLHDLSLAVERVRAALARAAWTGFLAAAREIADHGTFAALGRTVPFAELTRILGPR